MWAWIGRTIYWFGKPFWPLILGGSKRVKILIIADNKILLSKTWLGRQKWNVVGGGIRPNESSLEAAKREIKEETGLLVAADKLKFLLAEDYPDRDYKVFHELYTLEIAKFKAKKPWPELLELKWFDIDKLPEQRNPEIERMIKLHRG